MEVLQEGLYPKAGHFSSGPFTSGLLQEMLPPHIHPAQAPPISWLYSQGTGSPSFL